MQYKGLSPTPLPIKKILLTVLSKVHNLLDMSPRETYSQLTTRGRSQRTCLEVQHTWYCPGVGLSLHWHECIARGKQIVIKFQCLQCKVDLCIANVFIFTIKMWYCNQSSVTMCKGNNFHKWALFFKGINTTEFNNLFSFTYVLLNKLSQLVPRIYTCSWQKLHFTSERFIFC
jgi:hypothetical protein